MKTITSLNQKWWYRLIKVVYILSFVLIAVITVAGVYGSNTPSYYSDYQVVCNYGNKQTFLAIKDKAIFITDYDLRNGLASLSDYTKTDLQTACGVSEAEIQSMLDQFMNASSTQQPQPLYTITPKTITEGSDWTAVGYSALALLAVIIVFEIFRRIFYYIILGSIKPPKRE